MSTPVAPAPLPSDISAEALLRNVLDTSLTGLQLLRPVYAPDGITVVDFAYVYNNPAGPRMIGFAQQPGGTLLTHFPHTVPTGILTFYQRAFASDVLLAYEVNYQADGVDNYFTFSGQRSGEHLLMSFTDTSNQPRSAVEEALRQSQAREQAALAEAERQRLILAQLVAQAPTAMCVVSGPAFTYETFNPLYAAMFGGRPQVGRAMGEVLPEVANHPGFLAFRAVYEHGHTISQSEVLVPLARPGDDELENRYFTYTQQPRYNAQGQVDGVFVFAAEVTEQVLARQQVQLLNEELVAINEELRLVNEELEVTNQQLTRTNVDLDTFVYTASHDLKAPITNIEGLLDALRYHLPAEVQSEEFTAHLLGMMQGAVERFQYTITQLTDISRLQQAQNQPAERISLAQVVKDVRLDLLPLLTSTKAQLLVEISPEIHVHFAPKNLRAVVVNLLSNALKYHKLDQPPTVLLRAVETSSQVALTVTDNGLGLSEQQQTRLFHLFQRLHTHVEGSGVGLYMVKRILDNAGGAITVASRLGYGTMFRVTFPVTTRP